MKEVFRHIFVSVFRSSGKLLRIGINAIVVLKSYLWKDMSGILENKLWTSGEKKDTFQFLKDDYSDNVRKWPYQV